MNLHLSFIISVLIAREMAINNLSTTQQLQEFERMKRFRVSGALLIRHLQIANPAASFGPKSRVVGGFCGSNIKSTGPNAIKTSDPQT
jgi:hypothetical protein